MLTCHVVPVPNQIINHLPIKIKGGNNKYIYKYILTKHLFRDETNRPSKGKHNSDLGFKSSVHSDNNLKLSRLGYAAPKIGPPVDHLDRSP